MEEETRDCEPRSPKWAAIQPSPASSRKSALEAGGSPARRKSDLKRASSFGSGANESGKSDAGGEEIHGRDSGSSSQSAPRRLTKKVEFSFPDVDENEARRFVEGGSILQDCSKRPACFGSLMRSSRGGHYNVDEHWQFLQEATSPSSSSKRKWYLSDLSEVHPLVLDEVRISKSLPRRSRNAANLHLEFEAVHSRRRIKFRAPPRAEAKLWVTALQSHLVRRRSSVVMQLTELATGQFQKADCNDNGELELGEVRDMLKRLNVKPSNEYILSLFRTFDKDRNSSISKDEFKDVFGKMLEKVHLKQLFEKYSLAGSGGSKVMPCSELVRFLAEVQGELGHTEDSVRRKWLAHLTPPFVVPEGNALTESGFSSIMCCRTNSLFDPALSALHQDMSLPLSFYWINCSHNTYLEGAQIAGNASVERYLEVLSQGCRCVEIDLWDGPNGEPIVTHGYTLSSKISFEEVAQALKDHAFDHSQFPLILSLENHCGRDQTVRVGELLEEIFGERLLRHPSGSHKAEPLVSPEAAKGKVLVKGRLWKVPDVKEAVEKEDSIPGTPSRWSLARASSFSRTIMRQASNITRSSNLPGAGRFSGRRMSLADISAGIERFNSLIYLVAKKWHSITEDRQPCDISSFSASRAAKHCTKYGEALNNYHRSCLSRIFPPGSNVTSANFAPLLHWARGAQLVALNFQTMDTSVLLNEGLFREQNGGFGYVLKPPEVLCPQVAEEQEMTLTLTVLSAHFLPRPESMMNADLVTSPLVVVSLHQPEIELAKSNTSCSPSHQRMAVQHETAVRQDGFSPVWNETFEFQVTRKNVSLISFEVFHQDAILSSRSFMAAAAYPVHGLREGVRWVPLWDRNRREVPNCGVLVELRIDRRGARAGHPARASGSVLSSAHRSSGRVSGLSQDASIISLSSIQWAKDLQSQDSGIDSTTNSMPLGEQSVEVVKSDGSFCSEESQGSYWNFGHFRVHRTYVAV